MARNKIEFAGEVLIDLTADTVTPETLLEGTTAHDRSGVGIVGTAINPSGTINITENGTHDVKQYASANVNVQASGGDTLKALLDTTKSAFGLFLGYKGTSVDGLISYNATENVTTMQQMFYNCSNLTELHLLDTSNVTNMNNMLYSCQRLTTLPPFDTSNVTNMGSMLSSCRALTEVPLFDTSKATNMAAMLESCTNLTEVPLFDTSEVTSMENMIKNCSKLTEVTIQDMSKVTTVSNMFYGCTALKKVKLQNIGSTTKASFSWFYKCSSLEVIDFRGAVSVPTLNNAINTFENVPSTCKVVIPDSLYDTWTNATNWSAINVTWVKESEYVE